MVKKKSFLLCGICVYVVFLFKKRCPFLKSPLSFILKGYKKYNMRAANSLKWSDFLLFSLELVLEDEGRSLCNWTFKSQNSNIGKEREKEKEYFIDSFYDPWWRSPCWKQLDKLKKVTFPAQDWFENFFSQTNHILKYMSTTHVPHKKHTVPYYHWFILWGHTSSLGQSTHHML